MLFDILRGVKFGILQFSTSWFIFQAEFLLRKLVLAV